MLNFFSAMIEKETGIQYNAANLHLLENRLRDLAKMVGASSLDQFWKDVKSRGIRAEEREMVLDLATNNETSFFRDPDVFEFFRSEFVPQFTTSAGRIRIWSAACSTGQEPYSLAMILEELRQSGTPRNYKINATDFSDRVLKQAKSGIYSQLEVQRGLPAPSLVKFFEQIHEEGTTFPKFRIKHDLQKHIEFSRLNLLDAWPAQSPFDIIFCRNVLIYQDIENKKKVIHRLAQALVPGGFLVLGGAESLIGLSNDFDIQMSGKACIYRLKPQLKASA
jgi:chemotaxis protein methyltransferase CheR